MNKKLILLLVSVGMLFSPLILAEQATRWTLSASVQRGVKIAPEIKAADAEISQQEGKLEQAGAWPNPQLSIQVDNTLGLEDAAGGYSVTEFAISQPLPFSRLKNQSRQASASLAKAKENKRYQQLLLEKNIAQRFHTLQFAQAKLRLAEKRLQQAKYFQTSGRKAASKDYLVRYLTPLERMRLNIVLQEANQTVASAEGKYNEILASFKVLLAIQSKKQIELPSLKSVLIPAEIKAAKDSLLRNHPGLEANKYAVESARAGVVVAKSKRFKDPTLTLFQGQDFLGGRRQASTGIMFSLQVPLWNQNNGIVKQAKAHVYRTQAELEFKKRELKINFNNSYLHLGHLIEQAKNYRKKVLQPARHVFKLTRKGFFAGELNILNLIDANNTFFNTQERYLELLQQGWIELAAVRKNAGVSLLDNRSATRFDEVN